MECFDGRDKRCDARVDTRHAAGDVRSSTDSLDRASRHFGMPSTACAALGVDDLALANATNDQRRTSRIGINEFGARQDPLGEYAVQERTARHAAAERRTVTVNFQFFNELQLYGQLPGQVPGRPCCGLSDRGRDSFQFEARNSKNLHAEHATECRTIPVNVDSGITEFEAREVFCAEHGFHGSRSTDTAAQPGDTS